MEVYFTIFRAKVWKILILEWILLLEIQTNCKNWVCKEIGKLLGQKTMDEIDYFVPMSRNSFGQEFLQYSYVVGVFGNLQYPFLGFCTMAKLLHNVACTCMALILGPLKDSWGT
jgi:hypothetical protein